MSYRTQRGTSLYVRYSTAKAAMAASAFSVSGLTRATVAAISGPIVADRLYTNAEFACE